MSQSHEQQEQHPAATSTRPAMLVGNDSGSSSGATARGGAASPDGVSSSNVTIAGRSASTTPSDDDATSTAYFHSAASTFAGSGEHHEQRAGSSNGRFQQQEQQQQVDQEKSSASGLEAGLHRISLSAEESTKPAASSRSPATPSRQNAAASSSSSSTSAGHKQQEEAEEDKDGVVRHDFADQPVDESKSSILPEEGASSAHFSVVARSPAASTAPEGSSSRSSSNNTSKTRATPASYGKPAEHTQSRRPSIPFVIEQHSSSAGNSSSNNNNSGSQQTSTPAYTSSGPSRSSHEKKNVTGMNSSTSTTTTAQQAAAAAAPPTRQQSRAQKSIPAPNIDAAKQDYFSRHPDPDYGLRHGTPASSTSYSRNYKHASGSRPKSSSSHSTGGGDGATSERASFSGDEERPSNAYRDRGNSSSSAQDALLSPALSTGTLSSGVSVGPSMGGYERIFPIRSVVGGQRPLPHRSAATDSKAATSTSTSTSRAKVQKHRDSQQDTSSASSTSAKHLHAASETSHPSSAASNTTARQPRTQDKSTMSRERPLDDELETGTDYSRRSPIPDDVSDFSFDSRGSTRHEGKQHAQLRPHPVAEDQEARPSASPQRSDAAPLQRGDPASLYGEAAQNSPSEERRQFEIFRPHNTGKPSFNRNDSLVSATTGSSDMAGVSSISAHASSYPTTSRYSDDSDPTARKGTSTAPSTAAPTPGRGSSSASVRRMPGLMSITSDGDDSEPRLTKAGVHFDLNDPTQAARKAYEEGDAEEGPSVNSGGLGSLGTEQDGLFLTYRFEHQVTDDGHMIVTGRKGELLKCEDEPIHIPGAVQDYGVLIAVEENAQGHFEVTHVSENSGMRLGLPPKLLFSLNCFTEVLDEDQADAFLEAMEALDENNESEPSDATGATAPQDTLASMNTFQLSGLGMLGSGMDGEDSRLEWTCWCSVHRPDPKKKPKLAIIELEHDNDLMNPVMRERSKEEIDEDKAQEQSRSLFHDREDDDEDESLTHEEELKKHVNTGLDPSELPRTTTKDGKQNTSAHGASGPPDSLPGVGRADGEVADPSAKESSRHGDVGGGGGGGEADEEQQPKVRFDKSPSPEGLGTTASKEEIDASTISRIKPIRAMRRLRKQKGGGDVMKLFSLLGQINDELTKAQDLQTSLEIAVGVVAEITGFHRVMIYQFDEQWNGQVVAELVDYKQTRDLYRGLHFPASDIPAQARELYKLNKVRLLYDRDQPTARLVCKSRKELETPLNLTHSHLRAMSPIHVKYLANMGVRASMSISIIAFGQLWGLISCHTYGRYGQRVSFPGRQLCRIVGDSISRNIERLSYAQRLQSRKLINTIPTNSNPGGYIIAKAEDLLSLFDADFGVLSIGDEAKILGSLDNSQEVLAILEYLRLKRFDTVQMSNNILADFPDLDYPAGFQQVAGMLMVPLSRAGQDFIAFFRRGQLEHVHWAGNPYEKVARSRQGKKGSLEPRKSFKIWSETVAGKSRGWSDENMETASVLRLVYGKFIDVWRQREAAVTSSRLTSLLLSNASHEVRTPLNHIINYLEMALDGPLDDDTRESLVRSHSASRALVHVINDLLDLTRTEQNQNAFLQDPLDLSETIEEAVAIHRLEAQRRGVGFEIIENPSGTPQTLLGDKGKIRQIVANVTANAVKHTKEGKVTVEWGELTKDSDDPVEASHDTIKIGISITDSGAGIPEDQLEGMFRTFEQVETDSGDNSSTAVGAGHLGLGLAVVARVVSQLGGQLRVESKVGHGSKFTFVLHFRLPGTVTGTDSMKSESNKSDSVGKILSEGSVNARSLQKSHSIGSRNGSLRTNSVSNDSKPSDIESLVEVISGDPMNPRNRRSENNHESTVAIRSRENRPGQVEIEDSGTPLRSVRVHDGDVDVPSVRNDSGSRPGMNRRPTAGQPANPSFSKTGAMGTSSRPSQHMRRTSTSTSQAPAPAPAATVAPSMQGGSVSSSGISSISHVDTPPLKIMIVEDDAINRAILLKKLTKDFHHKVSSTVHGEEAVRLFDKDRDFDMILMDLQMPICDGFTATKRIRGIEENAEGSPKLDAQTVHPAIPSQVPIFAVSASLHENQHDYLLECGFSGFILKPINFARLEELMRGVNDNSILEANYYIPGKWEKGGWLHKQTPEVHQQE